MIIQMTEWQSATGKYRVNFPDLVGKTGAWLLPMRLMGVSLKDYVIILKGTYNANIEYYKDTNGDLSWVSFTFDDKVECRRFKNCINKLARDKKVTANNYISIMRRK